MTDIKDFGTLYKRDTGGDVRVWKMQMQIVNEIGYHRVVTGKLNGKTVKSGWSECTPKNVGKSNASTSVQQAKLEIDAKYNKKLELTYFNDLQKIDDERYLEPMLAAGYKPPSIRAMLLSAGAYAQPKLDGIRCIARANGLWSRKGKPIVSCPHLVEAMAPFFKQNPEAVLDGELYNHELRENFNLITSIVRKNKPSVADLSRSKQFIQYHVYDWVSDKSFGQRSNGVASAVVMIGSPLVRLVPTYLVHKQETLDELYGKWIEEEYEGQMVRKADDTPYEVGKRSSSLIKRKEFTTAEFPVIRVEEGNGNWSGAVKRFVLFLGDGKSCGSGVRGKYPMLQELLQSGNTPTWATVRFFGYTPDGVPRFPVAIDWGFGTERID